MPRENGPWGFFPKNNNPYQRCYECGRRTRGRHTVVPKAAGGKKLLPLCDTCQRAIVLKDILSLEPIKIIPKKRLVRSPKLTPKKVDKVKEMRAAGMTLEEIAKALNLSLGSTWKASR